MLSNIGSESALRGITVETRWGHKGGFRVTWGFELAKK